MEKVIFPLLNYLRVFKGNNIWIYDKTESFSCLCFKASRIYLWKIRWRQNDLHLRSSLQIVEISLAIIQLRLIYKQPIAAVKRDINLDRRAPLQRFFKFAPLCASRAKKIN